MQPPGYPSCYRLLGRVQGILKPISHQREGVHRQRDHQAWEEGQIPVRLDRAEIVIEHTPPADPVKNLRPSRRALLSGLHRPHETPATPAVQEAQIASWNGRPSYIMARRPLTSRSRSSSLLKTWVETRIMVPSSSSGATRTFLSLKRSCISAELYSPRLKVTMPDDFP